jgi:hypothetical protein
MEDNGFEPLQISDADIKRFSENFQLTKAGHFLTGVYRTAQDDTIFTSIYRGSKKDSILFAIAPRDIERESLGDGLDWFVKDERIYLVTKDNMVMIDYPPEVSERIIPKNGMSQFFKLCD